jgi:DNA gyrase/topoisomerase IV subunit A
MEQKTITEFLSNDYKEYAMYVIEGRAIPSIIDGFKPSLRKIIHVSNQIWKNGGEKALKVFQLAGKVASDSYYHHGNCLDINTKILLSDGTFITIEEWLEKYPDAKLDVVSYDEIKKEYTTGVGHSPRIGNITNIEMEIEMEDGSIVKCTENHPFLTRRGWIEAKDLLESDNIISISKKEYVKIKSIKRNILAEPKKFYDITVDKYHNFVINDKSMLVTHNSSLESAIIGMAQDFKNNAPLLENKGQYGSLRSPQAASARYLSTKLTDNFRLIYRDFELLKYKEEEGETIEPYYFLPILPTILLNGSSGIAVGFASNILNRNINDLIDSCVNILKNKKIKDVKPYLNDFKGSFIQDESNNKKWYIRGNFERINTTTVNISELPPSMTYEKYEIILDKLVDNKDIVSYDDNCKGNIDYTIKFTRSSLLEKSDDDLIKLLKLEENSTEIFTTLDENGKLKVFDNTVDIINYFVNFRLSYYLKRKEYLLNKSNRDLKILSNRGRFIKSIIDGKLIVNNIPKLKIIEGIESIGLDMIDDSYDYLLRMPIYSLTKEVYDKLKEDFKNKKEEIKFLEATEPKDMYITDLSEIKKKIK